MPRLRPSRPGVVLTGVVLAALWYFTSPSSPSAYLGLAPSDDLSPSHQSSWQDVFRSGPFAQKDDSGGLEYGRDGMVTGWEGLAEQLNDEDGVLSEKEKRKLRLLMQTHPIERMIQRGEKQWADMLARQSRTLSQAVKEYKRRYGRSPPRGFDLWWKFTQDNNVVIKDDVSGSLS